MDHALIEQIVTQVLAQLQPTVAVRAEAAPTPATTEIALEHAVITAEVLSGKVQSGQTLRIGTKSVLTPTAHDWLRERRIRWQRAGRSLASATTMRRLLLIGTVTPAVRSVRESLSNWKQELLGTPMELAEAAVRGIASGEAEMVVAISDAADVVACRANRNNRVRAAVPTSLEHVQLLVEHLGPNVLVINPRGRSFVELRNLVRAIAALNAPQPPANWD
jgi:hypothetical protein